MATPPPETSDTPAQPQSNAQIDAMVEAATPEDLERALRILLGAGLPYWERDIPSGRLWHSPRFHSALDLPPHEEREEINARIHADDRPRFEAALAQAMAEGGPLAYDVRYRDQQGRYRWMRAYGRIWLDEAGRPLRMVGTMLDVDAERRARADAEDHAKRYRRALHASSEAHFERTAGLDDFTLSDNFTELLGHPPGTPPPDRKGFLALVHPDDLPALVEATDRAWQSSEAWSATYRLRTADGGWRWFRGRGRTERDEHGRLRMSGMIGDVHQQELDRQELNRHRRDLRAMVAERTEALHAALAEAQAQRVQAERASAAKSEFLAHMSHELRTPLNGLLGLTALARKSAEPSAQQRYLDGALESGRALQQLIDELLDLSHLQAGAIEINQQPLDLPELMGEALRAVMPASRGKVMSLHYDWIGDTAPVLADAARVRQVLGSLLSNAVKFTPRGHVSLTGQLAAGPDGVLEAVVHVDDTGPGIAPADQGRIFEPFVQGDGSLTRPHGGSGLGLTIARRMARAMGGDVRLAHSGAAGSSFVFSWPVRPAAEGLAPEPPLGAGRVWLINGGSTSGPWFARRVARLGWSTKLFDDIDAAVAHAVRAGGSAEPEVVAVSYQALLPGADFAALRRSLPRAHIALLVRPDWDDPEIERTAAAQGALPVVLPLTPRMLRSLLRGPRAAPVAATPVPSSACARVLVVEDNAVNLMITEEFVRQLGHEPSGVADGAAALEACNRRPPDLVLMDLQMPVMDGLEATRRLRALQAEGRLPRFPIIGLSAHAAGSDRAQALAAGMDDFLTKPILLDALRGAIEPWTRTSAAAATP